MRAAYLAGGPDDGTILQAEDLANLTIPPGYKPRLWGGSTEAVGWREADVVAFVHSDVAWDRRDEAARAGIDEILKQFPDAGA